MTVNNSAGNVTFTQTDTVTTTLWSTASTQPTFYLQGALITGFPFIPAPQFILLTGYENFAPITDPFQGTLCGPLSDPSTGPCVPSGIAFDFGAFYIDNDDLKKNGNGKIKSTNLVSCTITASAACNPCACFGQKDDGNADSGFWKVQNPAGPGDYFNVRLDHTDAGGAPCANPATVTDIEAMVWDLCGGGTAAWASVGLYPSDTVLDPTGGTPLLASPIATSTSLALGAGVVSFTYPATIFDFPDVNASTNATLAGATTMNMAFGWVPGDSCTWIGGDGDGVDDDGGPTGTCTSIGTSGYYTANGYSSASIPYPVNWNMRTNWF
jgi:hypothetical protein